MLRAVIVDDERPALDELSFLLKKNSVEVIRAFPNTEGVLEYITREQPDIVFLDIELRDVNGIDFGAKLQNGADNTAIIFVTAYPEYALEAFRAYPLDYIVKPVDEGRLKRTLDHAREVSARRGASDGWNFYIRCFGKFEITCGANKVRLPTKKTHELLAYLLCNEGTVIYRDELLRLVFRGVDVGNNANNLRVTLFRIRNAFHDAGIGKDKFLIREDLSVGMNEGICDIVDFQRFVGKNPVISADNIAWAERTASLVNGELFGGIDALWAVEKREWTVVRAEELLINISMFYLASGQPGRAERALLRVIALNPVSEQGYRRLLDLYMGVGNALRYRCYYERYMEMAVKEFGERPLKYYADYYTKCAGAV